MIFPSIIYYIVPCTRDFLPIKIFPSIANLVLRILAAHTDSHAASGIERALTGAHHKECATYILLDVLVCSIAVYIFLRVVRYFDEPVGRVKIQTTSKNIQQYYTPKRLIRDLLSNDFYSQNSDLPRF